MLYAHLYNSPVGDISLMKDEMDLIGLSFSSQILNNIEAKSAYFGESFSFK